MFFAGPQQAQAREIEQPPEPPVQGGQQQFLRDNRQYDELVFYATDQDNHHLYFIEIRLSNVVLPRNMVMDDLVNAVRPHLMQLAHGSINRIKVGLSDRSWPTDLPVTHNVTGTGIKKNADTKIPWHQETFNINI